MWVVLLAWVVCLASLALPWPGIIIVASLCCLAFFEFVGPLNRLPPKNAVSESTAGGAEKEKGRIIWGPIAVVTGAFQVVAEALHRWRSDKVVKEKQEYPTQKPADPSSARPPLAMFLKGAIGSFSRGGLMVTPDGRVIYKINQDRGLIAHPSLNKAQHTIFGIFDGHGENGEHVAAYTMREVPRRLATHEDAMYEPAIALKRIFTDINASLPKSGINAMFGGTTAVVALVRSSSVWVANAGDSRAIVVSRGKDGEGVVARALTWDQNPDTPGERERIENEGGFVSEPEEPGASARVWLDATRTMVGLAMSRSIGDLAVKQVGVIPEPVVTEYELTDKDEFLVLASDGVWEFIDNQEAAEVVGAHLDRGEDAASACKGLMELANRRWSEMVGDYRDDITASVVRLPFLPPTTAARVATVARSARGDKRPTDPPGVPVVDGVPVHSGTPGKVISPPESGRKARGRADEHARVPDASVDGGSDPVEGGGGAAASPLASDCQVPTAKETMATDSDGDAHASLPRASRLATCVEDDDETISMGNEAAANDGTALPLGAQGQDMDRLDGAKVELGSTVAPRVTVDPAERVDGAKQSTRLPVVAQDALTEEKIPGVSFEEAGGSVGEESGKGDGTGKANIEKTTTTTTKGSDGRLGGGHKSTSVNDEDVSYRVTRASRHTDAMEDLDEEAMAAHEARGSSVGRATDAIGVIGGEGDADDDEDADSWGLDYGAREHREPSREMREASREFPMSSPDFDPLEALVIAGADMSRMA